MEVVDSEGKTTYIPPCEVLINGARIIGYDNKTKILSLNSAYYLGLEDKVASYTPGIPVTLVVDPFGSTTTYADVSKVVLFNEPVPEFDASIPEVSATEKKKSGTIDTILRKLRIRN
jgi:hypothetical protein